MASEIDENVRKGGLGDYSIYPPFPCTVFLKGELYSECCCRMEAKEKLFSLVHLIGFSKEDIRVIDSITGKEMFL